MGHPRPLFHLFSVFFKQTAIQFLQQINVKNVIQLWCRHSNPQPSDCESHPITTRPGIPPKLINCSMLRAILLPATRVTFWKIQNKPFFDIKNVAKTDAKTLKGRLISTLGDLGFFERHKKRFFAARIRGWNHGLKQIGQEDCFYVSFVSLRLSWGALSQRE